MLLRVIVLLFVSVAVRGTDCFYEMQKKNLLQRLCVGKHNKVITESFASFDELFKEKSSFSLFMNSSEIQRLYLEESSLEQIQTAQLLLLSQLYTVFLHQIISKITEQLKAIVETKRYWMFMLHRQKRFCMVKSMSFFWNHRFYEKVQQLVNSLDSAEIDAKTLLGASLCARHILCKVDNIAELQERLLSVAQCLSYIIKKEEPVSALDIFNHIGFLYSAIQKKENKIAMLLKKARTPHHIDRYWHVYSALLLLGIVGATICPQNKEFFVKYYEKSQNALRGFAQDFLVVPLKGLKRAVWDRPELKLEKFDMDDIPSTIWSCYSLEQTLKYALQTPLHNLNKAIELSGEIAKRQQVNYYLSAVLPIIAGMYGIYRRGCSLYNHKSYFKPMRLILRDIDILCNKLTGDKVTISFADHGWLYYLVLQMHDYVTCVQSNERVMLEYDISELLSFDFSISQKQKVVERMYRTYSFLK